MSRVCLDTSAYSRFQRGDPDIVAAVDRAQLIGIPVVVIGELLVGFQSGRRREENAEILGEFLMNPSVEILTVDAEVSVHYADIVVDLRRSGTPIPTNDIWIAATAARHGLIVLTYDDHFSAIARVGSSVLD